MTSINIDLAVTLDGTETRMLAIFIDSWGDKLVVPLNCETHKFAADFFQPCAHCGNAVLDSSFEPGMDTCDRCNAGHSSGFVPPTKINTGLGTVVLPPEDRTEEILDTMDKCIHWKIETCTGECWISDICTKRDELRKSAMLNMALTQTLPEDTMQEKITVKHVLVANRLAPMEERIKTACENALETFWDVIVKHFPDSNDGAFLMTDMDDIALSWVKHWVECNVPSQTPRGDRIEDLKLHYADTWHIWHSGGGCMLAITDNVAVAGQYNYLVISSDCVAIYEDKFDDETWMYEHLATWTFGDNPTVLMNQIDEFMGGNCLWDTGKLFDDIMTIGKSDLV